MTLTEDQRNKDNYNLTVMLTNEDEGFVVGGPAKTISVQFKDLYYKKKMESRPLTRHEFKRIYDRTNINEVRNMKPVYARITDKGSLIIE